MVVLLVSSVAHTQRKSGSEEGQQKEFLQLTVLSGQALSFPGSYRLRLGSVELGTFPPAAGVTAYIPFNSFYGLFGAGVSSMGKSEVGVIGGMGWDPTVIWIFGLRFEAYSFVGSRGVLSTGVGAGLSLKF